MNFVNSSIIQRALWGAGGAIVGTLWVQVFRLGGGAWATIAVGLLVGAGVGSALAASRALELFGQRRFWNSCLVCGVLGALGGVLGAGSGQIIFSASTSASDTQGGQSLFSSEMRARLVEANAKLGEIEIGLIWENTNDLDLHVLDPQGQVIFYGARRSLSGGELDVDRNASCSNNVTSKPVEHVVWPEGLAPDGKFEIYVHEFANCRASDPTSFRVELIAGGKKRTFNDSIRYGQPIQRVHSFEYDPEGLVGEQPARSSSGLAGLLARVIGWAIFGSVVGCAQGIVRQSKEAIRNATLGGTVGGGLGGIFFIIAINIISNSGLGDASGRFIGFAILGACIGLGIVIIERALSAVLAVRSGRYEGREIILDRPRMRLGRNDGLEIFLSGDNSLAPHHATIERQGKQFVIVAADGKILINGNETNQHALTTNDTITVGNTRMVFRGKSKPESHSNQTSTVGSAPVNPQRLTPRPPPPPPPPRRPEKKTS